MNCACGKEVQEYAILREGVQRCYDCAAKAELVQMKASGVALLYVEDAKDGKGKEIVNWPGTLRFKVAGSRMGLTGHLVRHNFAVDNEVWTAIESKKRMGNQVTCYRRGRMPASMRVEIARMEIGKS